MILALDQGTTSSRTLLVDHDGRIVAGAQQAVGQTYPAPGWVEQDPLALWRAQLDTAREVLAGRPGAAATVAAVGLANQRETAVVWERATGTPAGPGDRLAGPPHRGRLQRARPRRPRAAGAAQDRASCSIPTSPPPNCAGSWSTSPTGCERARRGELAGGTIDSWIAWNLTGGRLHVTDATNASRTLLYDINAGALGRRAARAVRRAARAAARRGRHERRDRRDRHRPVRRARCPSPRCAATSRRRSSATAATARARRSSPMAPAASC